MEGEIPKSRRPLSYSLLENQKDEFMKLTPFPNEIMRSRLGERFTVIKRSFA
jgi:hypothetical protein